MRDIGFKLFDHEWKVGILGGWWQAFMALEDVSHRAAVGGGEKREGGIGGGVKVGGVGYCRRCRESEGERHIGRSDQMKAGNEIISRYWFIY